MLVLEGLCLSQPQWVNVQLPGPKQASKKAQRLAEPIVTLSWEHPRYGYRRIRALLVKEGWAASRKFVQAVRRSEGLTGKAPEKAQTPSRGLYRVAS